MVLNDGSRARVGIRVQVFPRQLRWQDIAARVLHPPVAQHNSEWQLLDVLMHWPWDRVNLTRAGMGVVQVRPARAAPFAPA